MALNITTAVIGSGCNAATASPSLAQWDKGQILQISGVELPETYKVEFSNGDMLEAIPAIGTAEGVEIPDKLLYSSSPIRAYIVLSEAEGERNTEYWVTIYVKPREIPEDIEPDPAQQDVIDDLIAQLNTGVGKAEAAADEAEASAQDAEAASQAVQDLGVEAETLAPGAPAAVQKIVDAETGAVTLRFGLPRGADGASPVVTVTTITGGHRVTVTDAAGAHTFDVMDGRSVTDVTMGADYKLTFTFSDGTTWTTPTSIRGETGATPRFTIGTVSTLDPDQSATASITGTPEDPVLNLGIPKGQAGATDAGGVTYDPTESYQSGTAGAALNDLTRQLSDTKSAFTQLDVTVNGAISQNYTEGKNLSANSVSHNIIDDADSCLSDYIAIPTGVNKVSFWYKEIGTTVSNGYQLWFFDSAYSYLEYYGWSGNSSENRTVTVPTNAVYARFSFYKNYVGKLTENSATPSVIYYEAAQTVDTAGLVQKTGNLADLETTEKTNLVGSINEVKNSIPEFPINPDDTSFFHISKNMIDPSTCVLGELVNQATGAFQTASDHNRTTYIEIEPNNTYVVRERTGAFGSNLRYVFYTSAKAYISGAVGSLPDMLLTSPENAKYIVISEPTNPVNMMIAPYVDGDKSFEAFDNVYVKPQYIVAGDADDIILNVPEKMYALVGFELNIYFDNITENSSLYKWDVTCTKGMQLERGYRITPVAADVGTYTLTIRASISENIYKEVSTTLVVTAATAGSGDTATVIILGDSTTDNGGVITKLHEDFADDVMGVSTLGTRGTAPNNHEGRSGWNFNDYLTKASITYPDGDPRGTIYNPFYNPTTQTFDASYYFANSGIAKPDWFFVNLGINDMFGYSNDAQMNSGIDTVIERCNTVVESILDATTTTKVGICLTIPCNHSQDAFGKAYACSQTRDRCKRNNTFWVKKMIEEYSGRENERIYIIPINASLDTIYNMGMESIPVNSRNETTYSSPIANGGVHPSLSGYWQIADVYTALLKANA